MQSMIVDEIARHGGLLGVVCRAERHVVYRSLAHASLLNSLRLDVHHAAIALARSVADVSTLAALFLKAQYAGEHSTGRAGAAKQQRHALKTTDRVLRRNVAIGPCAFPPHSRDAHERHAHPIGIGEREQGLTEAAGRRLVLHALLTEPMRPVFDRSHRYAKGRGVGKANATPTRWCVRPRKEGQNCPGAPGLVSI